MTRHYGVTAAAVGLALATSALATPASACGGFFCSQAAGVNQAAERIVFAKNADDTVTAVIEIRYQGPSDKVLAAAGLLRRRRIKPCVRR